jgi:hypothetical protein
MVKLSLQDFAEATTRMIQLSGLKRTKLMLKIRPSDKKIVLKSTDNRSTLTTVAKEQSDVKLVDQIVSDFIVRSTRSAPAEGALSAKTSGSTKAKKGKGKK